MYFELLKIRNTLLRITLVSEIHTLNVNAVAARLPIVLDENDSERVGQQIIANKYT